MENEDIASDESDADEESEELLLASSSSSQSVQQALNNQLKSIDKKGDWTRAFFPQCFENRPNESD